MPLNLTLQWRPRAVPLAPAAVVGRGPVALRLGERLLAETDARLRGMAAAASEGEPVTLVALGTADDLPWVDGVLYLGRDADAPSLLLPTALEPSLPAGLLERALRRRAGALWPPIAVLSDPPALIEAGRARPIARALLRRWIEGAA